MGVVSIVGIVIDLQLGLTPIGLISWNHGAYYRNIAYILNRR